MGEFTPQEPQREEQSGKLEWSADEVKEYTQILQDSQNPSIKQKLATGWEKLRGKFTRGSENVVAGFSLILAKNVLQESTRGGEPLTPEQIEALGKLQSTAMATLYRNGVITDEMIEKAKQDQQATKQ